MKMFLDTSTSETILRLDDKEYRWASGHDLAENLHAFIRDKLAENGKTLQDLEEITFMSGPGSFTGLRIGAAVVNALASELNIPLYAYEKRDSSTEGVRLGYTAPWDAERPQVLAPRSAPEGELFASRKVKVIIPNYGRPANITEPRK